MDLINRAELREKFLEIREDFMQKNRWHTFSERYINGAEAAIECCLTALDDMPDLLWHSPNDPPTENTPIYIASYPAHYSPRPYPDSKEEPWVEEGYYSKEDGYVVFAPSSFDKDDTECVAYDDVIGWMYLPAVPEDMR